MLKKVKAKVKKALAPKTQRGVMKKALKKIKKKGGSSGVGVGY